MHLHTQTSVPPELTIKQLHSKGTMYVGTHKHADSQEQLSKQTCSLSNLLEDFEAVCFAALIRFDEHLTQMFCIVLYHNTNYQNTTSFSPLLCFPERYCSASY